MSSFPAPNNDLLQDEFGVWTDCLLKQCLTKSTPSSTSHVRVQSPGGGQCWPPPRTPAPSGLDAPCLLSLELFLLPHLSSALCEATPGFGNSESQFLWELAPVWPVGLLSPDRLSSSSPQPLETLCPSSPHSGRTPLLGQLRTFLLPGLQASLGFPHLPERGAEGSQDQVGCLNP